MTQELINQIEALIEQNEIHGLEELLIRVPFNEKLNLYCIWKRGCYEKSTFLTEDVIF